MDKVEQIKNEINKLIIPESKCSNISLMDNGRQYAYREVMEIIESLQDDTETDFGKKSVTKQSVEDVIAEIKEKSKAFTSLEQAKMLEKILQPESADMCYRIVAYNPNDTYEYQPYCFSSTLESDIPCWSLAALLGVLPNNENISTNLSKGGYKISAFEYTNSWFVDYEDETNYLNNCVTSADNPVDACYEMILKLHELKML